MSRGIQRERQVRKLLEKDGWWTARAAGSLGDADVIACRAHGHARPGSMLAEVWLVEVKSTSAGPFHSFGPQDRAELIAAAERAGAKPWLCYWPPRSKPRWLPRDQWPPTPAVAPPG